MIAVMSSRRSSCDFLFFHAGVVVIAFVTSRRCSCDCYCSGIRHTREEGEGRAAEAVLHQPVGSLLCRRRFDFVVSCL